MDWLSGFDGTEPISEQIAQELDLDKDDVYLDDDATAPRIVDNNSQVQLSGKWNVTKCTSLPDTRTTRNREKKA